MIGDFGYVDAMRGIERCDRMRRVKGGCFGDICRMEIIIHSNDVNEN